MNEEGEKISIQNVTDNDVLLSKGTPLIKATIHQEADYENPVDWEE